MIVYRFANLVFASDRGVLARSDGTGERRLRPQVGALLAAFLEHPQTLIEREQLVRAVWDEAAVIDFESGLAAVLRELRAEFKELGAAQDLIETVPRRGYRLRVPVQRTEARAGFSPVARKRLFGLTAALVVLIVAVVLTWPGEPEPDGAEPREWTLAVVPFDQFGEPEEGPHRLDLLLADQLLGELWEHNLERVILIGRASLARYRSRDGLAAAVADDLGIDLLVEGSVTFEGHQMRVLARLLEMPGGQILWSHQFEHIGDDPPTAKVLAQVLADSLALVWQERLAEYVVAE